MTAQSIPLTSIRFTQGFWQRRMELNRTQSMPFVFEMCEESGRIANFAIAGGLMPKPHNWMDDRGEAYHARDSDVFKIMEGAAYSLAQSPDAELDHYMDELIAKVAAAQEADGYMYTSRTIDPSMMRPDVEGSERWSFLRRSHELYNVGHLYEAAVAHFEATGKRALLDVATRNADLVDRVFGVGKKRDVCGHPENELALVRLYHATGDIRYLNLAKFFIDERGHANGRELHMNFGMPNHQQDNIPVVEQREVGGHAVRATYLFTGMADVAAVNQDTAYLNTLQIVWDNMVGRKMYLTGGIGSRHRGEAFGEDYELPNAEAYAETCGAIANMLWNQRMFSLFTDAKYIDVLELALFNGFLSGTSLSGKEFFYANPLASDGQWPFNKGSVTRQGWFDCPCCPTNIVRFVASLPAYAYALQGTTVFVNLFASSQAAVQVSGQPVQFTQTTQYPWDGQIEIVVNPQQAASFSVAVRIPGWTRSGPVPGDLYTYLAADAGKVSLCINGQPVEWALENGYAVLTRVWQPGDAIQLMLPMPVRRVVCREEVEANRGRVALMRGPMLYCVEGIDHNGSVTNLALSDSAVLQEEMAADLLGGVVVIQAQGKMPITAIPYYTWANRGVGEMCVWLPRTAAA